jgi:hypothetical protein
MQTLLDHIQEYGSRAEVETVRKVFNAMGMPVPQQNEFTKGNDGTLVFLNPAACVMRIRYADNANLAEHPHILEPLGRRINNGLVFDINPGIPCPANFRDINRLHKILAEDGFDIWDPLAMNFGYLPAVAGLAGRKQIPIVLDPGAAGKLSNTIEELNALFPGMNLKPSRAQKPRTDMQKILYAPLREMFNAAWPADDALPDRSKMDEFWKKCAQFKQEGKLVASWLGRRWEFAVGQFTFSKGAYKNVAGGAAYARRWNFPADF